MLFFFQGENYKTCQFLYIYRETPACSFLTINPQRMCPEENSSTTLTNFQFKTAILNFKIQFKNSLNAPVFQTFDKELQLLHVLTHRYLCKCKNIAFVNIFLIYSHYEKGKPFLIGLLFCPPIVNYGSKQML